jgi:hypothetical protein
LLPLYALGYVTTAWVLGRSIMSGPHRRLVRFLAGWAILRAIAIVPVAGALVWLGATVFGLGLLTVALWGARRSGRGPAVPARTVEPAAAGS